MAEQNLLPQQNRRSFLSTACGICGAFAAAGASAGISSVLEGCSSTKAVTARYEDKKIIVPASSWPKNQDGTEAPLLFVAVKELNYKVAIIKQDGGHYGLYMQCTHHDHPLETKEFGFWCHEHGSEFTKTGEVQKGPAKRPLKKFKVESKGSDLVVLLS